MTHFLEHDDVDFKLDGNPGSSVPPEKSDWQRFVSALPSIRSVLD
jgi:hypothetical protein